MRKIQPILFFLLIAIVVAMQFPKQIQATDWAYRFVVWEDTIYIVGEEPVTKVGKEIGHVTKYSDMKSYGGDFSNTYPKGTKYFSIPGVDKEIAIAVQVGNHVYVKAESGGTYEYKGRGFDSYLQVGLTLFAVVIIGAVIFVRRVH